MSDVLAHWSPAWVVLAILAAVAAVHLTGLRRERAWREPAWRELVWRGAAFHGGLLAVLLALISPLAYWSLTFIWVRSLQDLLLGVVAPALIVLGAPGRVLASGLLRAAGGTASPDDAWDRPQAPRARWWLAWPVAVTLAFNAVWLGWHVPVLYDLAATNAAARYLQDLAYLGVGIFFWLQLIGPGASAPSVAPMRRLALLVGTAVADTILGMVLAFGTGLMYPAYRGSAHHLFSVVADQQVAGAVLWIGMLPPLIIATMALLLGWLEHEESDELSRDLDRLTGQPAAGRPAWAGSGRASPGRAAWPARPGYRRPTI